MRLLVSAGRRKRGALPFVAFFCFCLGVFAVSRFSFLSSPRWGGVLARFGSGSGLWSVVFLVPWRAGCACVLVSCSSRSACARLLWRFRAARRWVRRFAVRSGWGGVPVPVPSVSLSLPLFGLRWLACRPVGVRVSGPGCWSLLRLSSARGC